MITEAPRAAVLPRAAVRPDRQRLALLALAHALTDSYGNSFLSPIFPLLAAQLGLSMAMVGSLPLVMGLSGSLAQPLLGYVSDRWSRLCLVALGPAVAAVGCGQVGHMPSYGWLLACMFVTGLGIGAFHPQGAALAKRASGGGSFAMSAFTVGGNIGFGLAPLAATLALRTLGLGRLQWISLPGLLLAGAIWWSLRRSGPEPQRAAAKGSMAAAFRSSPSARRPLTFLTASVAVRAAVQIGMTTFLPFYLMAHGLPGISREAAKGLAVSAFLLANAFAGPVGGHLSDRLGRKPVMLWSFLLSVPPLVLAFQLPGYWGIGMLTLGGAILAMPHPSNVIMAQELMPERAGIAASLITGLAWGLALLLAIPLGAVADHLGVGAVLRGLAVLPLLGVPLVLPIPDSSPSALFRSKCPASGNAPGESAK